MSDENKELLEDFDIEGIEAMEESETPETTENIAEVEDMGIDGLEDISEEETPASEEKEEIDSVDGDKQEEVSETENEDEYSVPKEIISTAVQPDSEADTFSMLEIEDEEEELSYKEKMDREEVESKTSDTIKETLFDKDDKLGGERIDRELIIVTDRPTLGIINYFRDCGVNVNTVFSSLEKAREKLMLQVEPCRVVILDTGLGKFSSMTERQVLSDILSFCDESFRISVFYCDLALKSDTMRSSYIKDKNKIKKIIDWHKFVNTVNVVDKLLNSNETYIDGKNRQKDDEATITLEDLMKFKPEPTEFVDAEPDEKFSIGIINIDELSTKTASQELAQIEPYKIKL